MNFFNIVHSLGRAIAVSDSTLSSCWLKVKLKNWCQQEGADIRSNTNTLTANVCIHLCVSVCVRGRESLLGVGM